MPDSPRPPDPHARPSLAAALLASPTPAARETRCRVFLTKEEPRIEARHQHGAEGVEVARARAAMVDQLLGSLFTATVGVPDKTPPGCVLRL